MALKEGEQVARGPTPGSRDRILEVSSRLFNEQGVRAVGMQQLVEEAGLGKSVLYREFASKDDLVVAWLRDRDAQWWQEVDEELARAAGDVTRQLLVMVELARKRVRSPRFKGCTFYNTVAEFHDPDHPARQEATAHLGRIRERLRTLADDAETDDPEALADDLMLIIAGMYATGSAFGADGPPTRALAAAAALIDLHRPGQPRR